MAATKQYDDDAYSKFLEKDRVYNSWFEEPKAIKRVEPKRKLPTVIKLSLFLELDGDIYEYYLESPQKISRVIPNEWLDNRSGIDGSLGLYGFKKNKVEREVKSNDTQS
jgi:hypothetical protein